MSVFGMCIKVKSYESLAEASALRFVARHTSIPVPKVYCAFIHKGRTYTVMSKINGKMACDGWKSRTEQSRQKILSQLREMVVELRSVSPPDGTGIGSVDNGPFYDCRLPSKFLWGPFTTTHDFHQALANDLDIDGHWTNLPDEIPELFQFYRESGTQLVLTHGDLIMVEGDEVTGIIDWETAGWFPSYWEYACAKNANPQNAFWADEVDGFLEPMPYELKMEGIRRRYFGDF